MGSPYVTFPGTTGRYASRAGVTLTTNNLDLRGRVRLPDVTPAANMVYMAKWRNDSDRSFYLVHTTTNLFTLYKTHTGSGGVAEAKSSATLPVTDGEWFEFRVTYDSSDKKARFWVDDVLVTTSTAFTNAGVWAGAAPFEVGSLANWPLFFLAADVEWLELLNDIDGAVLARYDAADVLEAVT